MKFGVAFAAAPPFGEPDHLEHLARTAEELGIESIWSGEHVLVPVGYASRYPYDPSGRMAGPENTPKPDPFLHLAYAAAATRKLRLATGIIVLPQRHPAYVAKEAATLDVLSGGRAILGIGIGWLREEFEAIGIPFEERAARTQEAVAAIRSLWKAEPEPFAGRFYRWGAVHSSPKPVQAGGVPIVIGGHTDAAARRAARYADGFFPGRGDQDGRLSELIGVLRRECERIGRDAAEVEITAPLPGHDLEAIRRLRDKGVARFMIAPPAFDKEGLRRGLEEFAERIISKF